MNRRILLEKYVRVAIKKAIQEQEAAQKRAEKSMYLIYRFPGLKNLMEDLMSPSFGRFVTDMKLVAPKPTTFSAKLINEQEFNIIYNGKGKFTVKIAGKKYNVQNLGELERAQQSIANILELNYGVEEKAAAEKSDAGAEAFSAATSAPAGEIPAEIPAGAEAPAEETPEEEIPAEA
jgi:hypothetical protein